MAVSSLRQFTFCVLFFFCDPCVYVLSNRSTALNHKKNEIEDALFAVSFLCSGDNWHLKELGQRDKIERRKEYESRWWRLFVWIACCEERNEMSLLVLCPVLLYAFACVCAAAPVTPVASCFEFFSICLSSQPPRCPFSLSAVILHCVEYVLWEYVVRHCCCCLLISYSSILHTRRLRLHKFCGIVKCWCESSLYRPPIVPDVVDGFPRNEIPWSCFRHRCLITVKNKNE